VWHPSRCYTNDWGSSGLALTISILLAVLGVAAFPCWRHSSQWGYAPSMLVGFLLVLVAAVTVGGRPLIDDSRSPRHAQEMALALSDIRDVGAGAP